MEIEKVNIQELISPEYNPRQITNDALESLKKSIKEFGYITPIVVNKHNMHVVGGNQRLVALKQLGYSEVDVVYVNIPDLNEEKALNIRLNNLSGEWDMTKLEKVIDELKMEKFDITLTGFDIDNVESFDDLEVNNIPFNETISSDLNTGLKPDEYTEPEHEITEDNYQQSDIRVHVSRGDLYKLGNHYLLCGDATNKKDLEILLTPEKERAVIDLVFTDPPYGMKKEKDGVMNDNLNYNDLLEFNKQWIPLTFQALKSTGSWYCWGTDEPLMDIYAFILKPMIKNEEITFRNLITWDKGNGQGQLHAEFQMYPLADEKCLFIMNSNQRYGLKSFKQIRDYLTDELNKTDLTTCKKINKVLGVDVNGGGMASHYFGKNSVQFIFPTEEMYSKLQNYCLDNNIHAFEREYEDLRREYEELRAYFNNTHDNMNNVWHFKRTTNNEREHTGGHATPKPIALCSRAILSSSRQGENILDIFGGSGSTLIACEETQRNCYMMELDPYYCQVSINRWETLTGKKAVKIN